MTSMQPRHRSSLVDANPAPNARRSPLELAASGGKILRHRFDYEEHRAQSRRFSWWVLGLCLLGGAIVGAAEWVARVF